MLIHEGLVSFRPAQGCLEIIAVFFCFSILNTVSRLNELNISEKKDGFPHGIIKDVEDFDHPYKTCAIIP